MTPLATTIQYELSCNGAAQAGFLKDTTSRHCAYVSGWGGGKTWALVRKLIMLCGVNRGPAILMGQNYNHILGTLVPMVEAFAATLGIKVVVKERRNIMLLRGLAPREENQYGCVYVHLISAAAPKGIRAINASHGCYDEPASYPQSRKSATGNPLMQVIGRVRGKWPVKQHAYATTEEGSYTAFHQLITDEKRTNKAVYRGTTTDNIGVLGADFILDVLESIPEEMHGQYLRGECGDLNQILAWWGFRESLVGRCDLQQGYPLLLMWDFNLAPLCVTVGQKLGPLTSKSHPLHCLDEHIMVASGNTLELAEQIAARWSPLHPGPVYVLGDATGKSGSTQSKHDNYTQILRKLRECEAWKENVRLMVPTANPTIMSRLSRHSALMQRGLHRVDPKCKNLLRDYRGGQLVQGADGTHEDQRDGYSHSGVGVGYGVCSLFPLSAAQMPSGEGEKRPAAAAANARPSPTTAPKPTVWSPPV